MADAPGVRKVGLSDGGWGPTMVGGRSLRWRRYGAISVAVLAIVVLALAATFFFLVRLAEGNIDRLDVSALAEATSREEVLNVLVVGSDSRAGLTDEQIQEYDLGSFTGQRGDTVLLVSISPKNAHASVVSFPRDLLVVDDGERKKLTETFADGPDNVVEVLHENTGVPIHHYVEVSIPGFIGVVESVGGVRLCLEEELHDEKSGADFEAGCHDFTPKEALAFVRSRSTARGDFDRIDRQQQFMKAMLDRVVATDMLVNLPRLFNVVESVSKNLSTDRALTLADMRRLAQELRGLASGTIPMVTIPSYTSPVDGRSYVVPYEPGARAIYERLEEGLPLTDQGPKEERAETSVAIWSNGHETESDLIHETLSWAAFRPYDSGTGPLAGEVAVNTVFAAPDKDEQAGWVAGTIGGEVAQLPEGVEMPSGADVVVVAADRSEADLQIPGEASADKPPVVTDESGDLEQPPPPDSQTEPAPPPEQTSPPESPAPAPSDTASPDGEGTASPSPSPSEEPSNPEPGPLPSVTPPGSQPSEQAVDDGEQGTAQPSESAHDDSATPAS